MDDPPLHIGVKLLFTQQDEHADEQDDLQRLLPEGNSNINNALLKIAREPKQILTKTMKEKPRLLKKETILFPLALLKMHVWCIRVTSL